MRTQEEKQKICEEYKSGATKSALIKKYHIDYYTLKNIFSEFSVIKRSEKEILSKLMRKYQINEDYFNTENHNMAYILGFLAADGCVTKDRNMITILLSIQDIDILEKINKLMSSTYPIKTYEDSNGRHLCKLSFTSEKIKKDLSKYNIIPNKTFVPIFPDKLNSKYLIDWLRGYWDGDGWISKCGHGLIFGLCSAIKENLIKVQDILEEYGIARTTIYERKRSSGNSYEIHYSTNASKRIYELFYQDKNLIFLTRKYNKFSELISNN